MAIYSLHLSEVSRGTGGNAIASAAYISGSRMTFRLTSPFISPEAVGNVTVKTWDFCNKPGVVYSAILAPDGSPSWVYDRETLWNAAENFELSPIAQTARKLMIALPRDLTQEQNIELAREFALSYLVSYGMVVDLNIHYDNEHNPHMHLQMTTRELSLATGENDNAINDSLANDNAINDNVTNNSLVDSDVDEFNSNKTFASNKNRYWGSKLFLNCLREGVSTLINHHLELHGHLDRVSHLSHEARSIELLPGIHEGAAHHMEAADRRLLNEAILSKNAAAIRENPELVFHKLSINKPVFTKEEIAAALSDALYYDMTVETASGAEDSSNNSESLHSHYATEFMLTYESLLKSPQVKLVNPCDLRGRTLYALTKRLELENRFIGTVEELGGHNSHSIDISEADLEKQSISEWIGDKARDVGIAAFKTVAQAVVKATGLPPDSLSRYLPHPSAPLAFTEEQKAAIVSIVSGSNISLLEGFPGSGKTATMREIVRQFRKAGYRVIGTATSASAAEVLGIEAGIESKNISRLRKEWQFAKNPDLEFELILRPDYYKEDQYSNTESGGFGRFGSCLSHKDVLIIDEASMVELSSMDYLLSEVKAAGAKAILIGDNNQLAAIGMTGAFKKASQIVGSNQLTEVMRHRASSSDSTDIDTALMFREATKLLGHYKINEALDIYQSLGAFNIHKTPMDAKAALVKDYIKGYMILAKHLSTDNLAATKSLVIGAYTNKAVDYFNNTIRGHLKAAGILKGRPAAFRSGNETIELTRGEQIVFTENKQKFRGYYGVLNGEVGTVLNFTEYPNQFGAGAFTVLIHKADGSKRVVTISTKDDKDNLYPARFKHGYAVTGHKLQGDTANHMMVYYEPIIGYEAFNVLMTRHRETVRLYLDEESLENVVYSKMERNINEARVNYSIEAYKLSPKTGDPEVENVYDEDDQTDKSSQSNKAKIPAWRIGLAMAISRRADNSFSRDYIANDLLTEDQQVIKGYLESRELTFALKTKLKEWKERESTPAKLALLTKLTKLKLQKHHINPYLLIYAAKELEELEQGGLDAEKADKPHEKKELKTLAAPIKPSRNQLFWNNLSILAKEELKAIFDELMEAKENLAAHARLICDNYHGSLDKAKNSRFTMGNLLVQLSMSYEPIERHAGYSDYRYYLKDKAANEALALNSNPHFNNIISTLRVISRNAQGITEDRNVNEERKIEVIAVIQSSYEAVAESINDTRLKLLKTCEEVAALKAKDVAIKSELEKLVTFTSRLFPEYLSRIYRESPSEVIAKWDGLVQANNDNDINRVPLSRLTNRIYNNPKLLGNLRGLGLGDLLGITTERQNAIANLEVISQRLKSYETGKSRLAELNEYQQSNEYKKLTQGIASKTEEIKLLESSLPAKHEEKVLSQLAEVLSSNNNHANTTYSELKHLSSQDDVQNLIYESYNHRINKQTGKGGNRGYGYSSRGRGDIRGSKDIRQYSGSNLTWEGVSSRLTSVHYEQIFRHFAHEINEDAPKITKSGDRINCGSLGMNLKNGLWKRFSSNESGNIYSFVSLAGNIDKSEALRLVASFAGIDNYQGDTNRYEYRHNERKENASVTVSFTAPNASNTKPINEWVVYSIVPQEAKGMNPAKDFAWIMKEHAIDKTYEYRNINGEPIGGTMRLINKATQEKQVLPYAYCKNTETDQSAWRFKGFTDHGYKPIYGLEKLSHDRRTILIVEGEKTADAAQKLLPEYAVMSWLGGSSAVDKVNWEQLKNRNIVIWPDNDLPGKEAATKILNHINLANDKVGYAAIVDLNLSPADKKHDHNNNHSHINNRNHNHSHNHILFPEKWDLADKLPEGVGIKDIKYAIEEAKERSRNPLHNPEQLDRKTPESVSNTIQVLTPELLGQYRHLEVRGIISYSHEFLKPEHGLYRDTLTCLLPQIRQQTQESESEMQERDDQTHKVKASPDQAKAAASQRNFITTLESKYEALINKYSASGIGYLEHYDSIHYKHEKALADKGHDRVELYKTMVRDVTLLHSLEQRNNNATDSSRLQLPKLTKTHHEVIAKTTYDAICNYKRPFSKRMQSNSLAPQEKITIAQTIHATTTDPVFKQNLTRAQSIEPPITKGMLRHDLGVTFSRIVHVGIPQQLQQVQQATPAKQVAVHAEDAEAVRQIAHREASGLWLINNRQPLTETEYELCIHRAIFELKASNILKNSSDFNAAQIADQAIANNPYSETIAAIISHEEIYISKEGNNQDKSSEANKSTIIKSQNRLLNLIDKRDLVMKANQIFEERDQRVKEALNDYSSTNKANNTGMIPQATSKTEGIINRILAQHIADHEMIYGKGTITTEKIAVMREIAKHEANLEVAMRREWSKEKAQDRDAQEVHEAKKAHETQQAYQAQKTQKASSAKTLSTNLANATKAKVSKQNADINTSIAVARHRMRQEMYVAVHQYGYGHGHIYSHLHSSNHDQSHHIDIHHSNMEARQNSYFSALRQIAHEHHAHINDHIVQVKDAQKQLERSNREQAQERQRLMHHRKGVDMGM